MKKLSLAMALVMILAICASTMGMSAFADATYKADTVAVIGTTEYSDIQSAFDAYKSGDTITLVKDYSGTAPLKINGSGWVDGVEGFKNDKPLIIEGNGKSISIATVKSGNFAVTIENANVVFKNVTINAKYDGVSVMGTSHVVFKDSNIYASNTTADEHVTGDWAFTGSALKLDNNTKAYIEIDGGNYKASGTAKTNAENGKVTYAGNTFMDIRQGRLVIKGGNFDAYNCNAMLQAGAGVAEPAAEGEQDLIAGLWVYGGNFVRHTPAYNASNGILIRSFKGGVCAIYDGTFINYPKDKDASCVIGAHSGGGAFTYIMGGDFYNFSDNPNSTVFVGDKTGVDSAIDIHAYLWGGNFYSKNVEGRIAEAGLANDLQIINNKNDINIATEQTTVELKVGEIISVTKYAVTAKDTSANAVAKVENADGTTYYTDSMWKAVNVLAKDGAKVTLLKDVDLTRELIVMERPMAITVDGAGKKITTADGVANAIAILGTDVTFENATIENKSGTVFTFGYVPDAEEAENSYAGVLYTADVTLKNTTVTSSGTAYAVKNLLEGDLVLDNATVDGAVKTETVVLAGGEDVVDPGTTDTEPVDTDSDTDSDTTPVDTKDTDSDTKATEADSKAPDTGDDGADKGGCGSAIGISAMAVLAVVGVACGIASKKRED